VEVFLKALVRMAQTLRDGRENVKYRGKG